MVLEETDKAIIEACQRGESDAFRALFERYKNKVYSIALRYSGEHAVAQDIAQETFLKLFVGIKSFRNDCDFTSWLYRVVVNSRLDQKRRRCHLTPLLDEVMSILPTPEVSVLDEVLRAEMNSHVREVVDSLRDEQRMLLVLRYTQGLSYDAIAEILGSSTGTIASRLSRIHKVLERRLIRYAQKEKR